MKRTQLAIWFEEMFREVPRPTTGPWPMTPEQHAAEDADWERIAKIAREVDKRDA